MDSNLNIAIEKWQQQNRWTHLIKSVSLALILFALTTWFANLWAAFLVFIFLTLFFWLILISRYPLSKGVLIKLLNSIASFEQSSELFFKSEEELSLLERLQVQKIRLRLSSYNLNAVFPDKRTLAIYWLVGSLAISALISLLGHYRKVDQAIVFSDNVSDYGKTTKAEDKSRSLIKSVKITIAPPPYTQQPLETRSNFNLVLLEQSEIIWEVEVEEDIQEARIVFGSGKSIPLTFVNKRSMRAKHKAAKSDIYSIQLDSLFSEFYTIDVKPDLPPSITLISPELRSTLRASDSSMVLIRCTIRDDYKTKSARLIITKSTGKGESVKFNSDTLQFNGVKVYENNIIEFETTLDIIKMGLLPGDELYGYIEAKDNREPIANRSQSESFIVDFSDTLRTSSSESLAMPVLQLPAYFRSQRQLIIDTETLINQKKNIDTEIFNARSENLGVDQKLLRLRYGKFVGEELAISIGESNVERLAKTMRDSSKHPVVKLSNRAAKRLPKVEDAHDHNESEKLQSENEKLIEPYLHRHDIEEAATFFPEPVKIKLKAALSEMWEAEKHLRMLKPENALKHEIIALQLIKEVQTETRAYVQKSGFEPHPFTESDVRFSGDPSKIQFKKNHHFFLSKQSFQSIRNAIPIVEHMGHLDSTSRKSWKGLSPSERIIIEQAGKELAKESMLNDGKYLIAIQSLNQLLVNDQNKVFPSPVHLSILSKAFYEILPVQNPTPNKKDNGRGFIVEQYLKKFN